MSQTLYRKYRPKNFAEIIGQKHIVQTLTNAVKHNRVGQAYLFTGPRGTGKTSIARILAKTINCENPREAITCEKCPACQLINDGRTLDIIEIDAASNTGVENIRELRETVALPPTALKYKVYIIDEVHMLSSGAFNALLKTLEEPPAHVVFILATTEIHKVPETIISRCQRFDFARLPIQNIIEKLTLVAKSEKIKIDKAALEMIAIAAEGGMRDAESLLGQVIALEDKNITLKEVEEILGTTDRKFAHELTDQLIANDSAGAIAKINTLLENGYDLSVFAKSLVNYLRQLMLLKISPELQAYFSYEMTGEQLAQMKQQAEKIELPKIISAIHLFLEAQSKISAFLLPQLPLEIAVIKATHTFPADPLPAAYATQSETGKDMKNMGPSHPPSQVPPAAPAGLKKIPDSHGHLARPEIKAAAETPGKQILTYDLQSNWPTLLEAIQPYNHSLKALLSNCRPQSVSNNVVTLATPYGFYKDKLLDRTNRLTVEEVFGKILGAKITIEVVVDKNMAGKKDDAAADPKGSQDSLLKSAMEIMGGKIVEE